MTAEEKDNKVNIPLKFIAEYREYLLEQYAAAREAFIEAKARLEIINRTFEDNGIGITNKANYYQSVKSFIENS